MGAALGAMGALGVISLYQFGLIQHLPDPPLPGFDADKVHGLAVAYGRFATPDGVLGLGSYAATAVLTAMGGPDRAAKQPWVPLALAAKVCFDLTQAAVLTRNELTEQHALSAWSLITTGATCAMVPFVLPEAYAALRKITRMGGKGIM